jgi:inactivated superfamily I helicase
MNSSLSWIEWLDRLDRVLTSTRQDVAALSRSGSARSLSAIERSKRQLSALMNDMTLLDPGVLASSPGPAAANLAGNLQQALGTTVRHLDTLRVWQAGTPAADRDRVLAAIDAALRDSCYEAAILLGPRRRRA